MTNNWIKKSWNWINNLKRPLNRIAGHDNRKEEKCQTVKNETQKENVKINKQNIKTERRKTFRQM